MQLTVHRHNWVIQGLVCDGTGKLAAQLAHSVTQSMPELFRVAVRAHQMAQLFHSNASNATGTTFMFLCKTGVCTTKGSGTPLDCREAGGDRG